METLQDKVILALIRHNFIVKTISGSFDVVARKDDKLLVIKVLEDANSIPGATLQEMVVSSGALSATPLIVCAKATAALKDNIIYLRQGIPTCNIVTFSSIVSNKPMYFMSKKAGITTEVQGRKLKQWREEQGMSLGALSRRLGVSKRMVVKYESGGAEVSLQKAIAMHTLFGSSIFKSIDVLATAHQPTNAPSSDIGEKYGNLGFTVQETKRFPFDVVATMKNTTILTKVGDRIHHDLNNISAVIGANELVIFRKRKPQNIPAMTKEEFLEFEEATELIKFVHEYQE